MPEQKMKITEEAFADFTGHVCGIGFTHSISDEPLGERQQRRLAACLKSVPFVPTVSTTPAEPTISDDESAKLLAKTESTKRQQRLK
ncbi:hypothetical protein ACB435_004107 [Enterobacter hormaechei]